MALGIVCGGVLAYCGGVWLWWRAGHVFLDLCVPWCVPVFSSARWVLIACCVLLTKLGPSVVCASAADYAGLWFVLTVLGFASSLGRTHHLSVAAFPSLFIMLSMYTL